VLLKAADAESFAGNALIVADPYLAYARISHLFDPKPKAVTGKFDPSAVVAEDAQVDASASVGPFAVIEAVRASAPMSASVHIASSVPVAWSVKVAGWHRGSRCITT
jgi:UDP-3-O-[3-hydroxymyristoyl] glucosamine N-acyltransferase (EC 2.3.1.-)